MLMDYRFPIILLIASILVSQLIPGSIRIALESGIQDWIDWNIDEGRVRKKMIINQPIKIY